MLAQRVQSHFEGVVRADAVLRAELGLDDAEDGLDDRGLARARPAHDAHLRVPLDREAQVLEHQRQSRLVPSRQVPELQRRLFRPRGVHVPVLLGREHFLLQPRSPVVVSPQRLLGLEAGDLVGPLVADHEALGRDDLPQEPLEAVAEVEEEDDRHSEEAVARRAGLADADVHAHEDEHEPDEGLVEAEAPRDQVEGDGGLGRPVHGLRELLEERPPPAVGPDLHEPADGLAVGLEDRVLVLQVHLLALHDDCPGVVEEDDGDHEDDDDRGDEVKVDLGDVDHGDQDRRRPLQRVDQADGQRVVQDAEVV